MHTTSDIVEPHSPSMAAEAPAPRAGRATLRPSRLLALIAVVALLLLSSERAGAVNKPDQGGEGSSGGGGGGPHNGCGGCPAGQVCSGNQCVSTCRASTSCQSQAMNCGTLWDGCQTESCGS